MVVNSMWLIAEVHAFSRQFSRKPIMELNEISED